MTNKKFTFTYRDNEREIIHNVNEEILPDVFDAFKDFLRGCGYFIRDEEEGQGEEE